MSTRTAVDAHDLHQIMATFLPYSKPNSRQMSRQASRTHGCVAPRGTANHDAHNARMPAFNSPPDVTQNYLLPGRADLTRHAPSHVVCNFAPSARYTSAAKQVVVRTRACSVSRRDNKNWHLSSPAVRPACNASSPLDPAGAPAARHAVSGMLTTHRVTRTGSGIGEKKTKRKKLVRPYWCSSSGFLIPGTKTK